jgi:hypothetical protein
MTYLVICAMEKLGLAWNIVRPVPGQRDAVLIAAGSS